MTNGHISDPLLRLFTGACDFTLQADEQEQLSKILQTDAHARQQYSEFVQLHTDLRFAAKAQRAGQRAALGMASQDPLNDAPEVDVAPVARSIVMSCDNGFFTAGAAEMQSPINPNQAWWFGFAALTVPAIGAVTLVAIVALFFAFRAPTAPVNQPSAPAIAINNEKPVIDPVGPAAPTSMAVRTIRLESGSTTLDLPEIGTVVVEGPANFELLGPMRARLHHGRIKVHVTQESGHGFVVETPDGEVTDLGTEFGLEVSDRRSTGLVVFQGTVDLRVGESLEVDQNSPAQRLFGGEGVMFSKTGQLDRIMAIATGTNSTFQLLDGTGDGNLAEHSAVITHVADNVRTPSMRKFYQVVLGGLREDALSYVDRPAHQWNGVDDRGIPNYLIGADYVKTFNDDKIRDDVEISVAVCRPADLYVFLDVRVPPPDWLLQDFENTGDKIGLDNGPFYATRYRKFANYAQGVGSGQSIDEVFSIWKRVVTEPGVVTLGKNAGKTWECGMYAIAAVKLDSSVEPPRTTSTAVQAAQVGDRRQPNSFAKEQE